MSICVLLSADDVANSSGLFGNLESTYIVITIIAVVIVSIYQFGVSLAQRRQIKNERFIKCSNDIYLNNETAQIAAAIQLREFLKDDNYRNSALNLIVSLLRILPTGNLQKTLADSISSLKQADGYDFQNVNMNNMLIKPQPYIKKQIQDKSWKRYPKLSLKKVDFYESEVSNASINWVNADGVIFYGCTFK